jgi:hypothetical protein
MRHCSQRIVEPAYRPGSGPRGVNISSLFALLLILAMSTVAFIPPEQTFWIAAILSCLFVLALILGIRYRAAIARSISHVAHPEQRTRDLHKLYSNHKA